ncbi:hypothetical protein Acr_25g0007560 [Actinidia rufa]|uniref:R13L1/DRL21-like LRR repeat region domain-containing protein n=1 Tax=Actinidia rufa TaxID=165716 RepID=A0A7J0GZS9_9ERIC|nr:hypothetical protein Acr_25g0007560 [Actinidia rufa]
MPKKPIWWKKQNLRWLKLCWNGNAEFESQENVEQLLESLEPHPNIKGLVIHHYKGSRFPLWMRESNLRNVVEIELNDCENCSQLPPFGKLPLLKRLVICRMDKVRYIDDDFPGDGPVRGFPSLEVLHIHSLPNLKGLSREEGRELLPRLREMSIGDCPNFRFPCLLSLIKLEIHRFTKLGVFPRALTRLVALKSLHIHECPKLESLPEEGLQGLESLQFLEILDCEKLSSLSEGLRYLTALENLYIN